MRILADENCDTLLVSRLREDGHDVEHIAITARGSSDRLVFASAEQGDRILLTHDLDFGHLAERAASRPPAIVLMRLDPLGARKRADIVSAFFRYIDADWRNSFFVIEPGSTRRRALHTSAVRNP
jgi:predicted nuclease of predicted toxin-antitoxin system